MMCAISDISTFFFLSLPSLFIYKTNLTFFPQNHRQRWHEECYQLEPFLQTQQIHTCRSIRANINKTDDTVQYNVNNNVMKFDHKSSVKWSSQADRNFENLKSIEWVDGRENDRYGGLKKKKNSPSKIIWFITRLRRTMRKHFPPISVPLSQWKNTWQIKSKEKAMKLL